MEVPDTARGVGGFGSTDRAEEEGGRVWLRYPGQHLQSGEIVAREPRDTYWVSIVGDNDLVCLDRGKLS